MIQQDPCCDIQSSFFLYDTLLKLYGATEVYYIPVTKDSKDQNSNADVVAHIKTLTGFFFTGGDQTRIIYSLYNSDEKIPSPVLLAIRETLLATGGVVAGTSAGTDCLTSYTMITGGASYNGLVNGTKLFWRTAEYSDEDILTAYGPGSLPFIYIISFKEFLKTYLMQKRRYRPIPSWLRGYSFR